MKAGLPLSLVFAAALGAAGAAMASGAHGSAGHGAHATPAANDATDERASGEVRRIDKEQRKITLRHGEIKRLGMPPMTMVFQVRDPSWLDRVKVGDKVSFQAENINGAYTVTDLQVAP
jgi:Cu/Ag efflux protein CusF